MAAYLPGRSGLLKADWRDHVDDYILAVRTT